jgi:phospholipid/cholesterol/gamma-HCH transport system permease protein
VRDWFALNGQILYWLFAAPFKGVPLRPAAVFQQMVRMGVQAVPMTALTSLSIGITLAMQAAHELAHMGATAFIPNLVALSLLRELGPLLVGVVVIGRSGSAVTAELGTMKVSEEIEALEVMAINPVRFLVIPRVIAMMIMLPVLTVFGNYIGMAGGWAVCHFSLDMDTANYIRSLIDNSTPMDFYSGMVKSVIFAWLIITISCVYGLGVKGGAEGVGRSTTSSVVVCILTMLIADACLTAVFFFGES